MSEILRPVPLPQLIKWVLGEYKNEGSVFGIKKEDFFRPASEGIEIFGRRASVPIGVSAGPYSQLAQNILAAFLAGARFIELKTVQPMDGEELRKAVARPNINVINEGYNVQWTTELTVAQTLEEYVKAWFLCHIFAVEFNISEKADIIFTMNAGYSLEGIKSEKIDSYIEGMKNAQNTEIWQRCYEQIAAGRTLFSNFTRADLDAITPAVSDRINVSTFYSCPCDETEKIASWFINEKKLMTYIKCSPTLLGFKEARALLDETGYSHISFDDHHFRQDIQLPQLIKMLRRLKASSVKPHFPPGVKLTNTLPVEIKHDELPGKVMYLSGKALFPLAVHTAKKISNVFRGEIPISYSGGADFFNLKAILETGIRPVTMLTNLLKPGGLGKLSKLAQIAQSVSYGKNINLRALNNLCSFARKNECCRKDPPYNIKKTDKALPLFDCAQNSQCNFLCAEVCPNRANILIHSRQILHLDFLCNECGNCASFCTFRGRPFKDKPTLFSVQEDFEESQNPGFCKTGKNTFKIRLEDKTIIDWKPGVKAQLPPAWLLLIETVLSKYPYLII